MRVGTCRISRTAPRAVVLAVCAGGVVCGAGGGCAKVNPRPDFEQVSELVRASTGGEIPPNAVYTGEDALQDETDAPLAEGLTSEACARLCVRRNPRVRAALSRVGAARADVVQASLLSNPGLSLSSRFPDGGGLTNLEVAIAQNLSDWWLIPVRRRAAEGELEREILAAAREVSETVASARAAYFEAVAADEAVALAREHRDLSGRLVEVAEARRDAGVGSEIDVNLARAEGLRAEITAREVDREAFEARRRLCVLIGVSSEPRAIVLTEALPEAPDASLDPETVADLSGSGRLDVRAAEAVVRRAAARVVEARRSVFGEVEVGVAMERADRPPGGDKNLLFNTLHESAHAGELVGPELYNPDDGGQDVIIGPTLSFALPIFDQNQAGIARAEFELIEARLLLEALRLDVVQQARSACVAATTAWGTSAYYRDELLPLVQTNLDLSREAYRSGKVSVLSVIEAQRALAAARRERLDVMSASARAVSELEKAVGLPITRILAPQGNGFDEVEDP
ncbi:MAG: hypothetical protein FLDDKLPJ_00628 [Phycisphaerae bacterium]|nr:hypothetical protein [Phycisphaerae bacterium]